jgi:hypothetical protein
MKYAGIIVAGSLCMVAASTASAGVILETEVNNTLPQANPVGLFNAPGGSILVDGSITPTDVDWFQFTVTGPTQLVSATFGIPNSTVGDSILSLYDGAGVLLDQDDDDGIGNFSALEAVLAPGTYYLVVTGFPDFANTGQHAENFTYKMSIGTNVVPAPGVLALLAAAGLVGKRRRRA